MMKVALCLRKNIVKSHMTASHKLFKLLVQSYLVCFTFSGAQTELVGRAGKNLTDFSTTILPVYQSKPIHIRYAESVHGDPIWWDPFSGLSVIYFLSKEPTYSFISVKYFCNIFSATITSSLLIFGMQL